MTIVFLLIKSLTWIVVVDAVLSWIVRSPHQFPRNVTGIITEPLYRPIRAVLDPQKTGGFDLSPLIVIVALQAIASLVGRLPFAF